MSPRSTPLRVPTARNVRRRLGLTLVEATMVLAVVTLIFVGFAQLLGDASENMRIKASVDRLKEVAKASEMYIAANQKKIRENIGDGYVAITITGTAVNSGLPSVQNAGFLSQSFVDQNSYNQSHRLFIRTLPSADPANTKVESRRIEAIVTTVASLGAGNRIPFRQVGRAAQMMGSQGGFCRGSTPTDNTCTYVLGAGGGWRVAASDIQARPGSIQAALFAGDTGFVSDYLNRNDIGDKEANTMRTTMYAAPASGQYAMEQDPNTGTTVLKIGPDVSVPGYVEAGNYLKAGTSCGETGQPGDVVACGNVRAMNDVVAEGNVTGQKFIDRNDPNYFLDPTGKSNIRDIKTQRLDINNMVVYTTDANDRFNSNGNPGQDVLLRDMLPRYVSKDGYSPTNAPGGDGQPQVAVEVPVCPGGGIPKIFLAPMQDSFSFDLKEYVAPQISTDYLYKNGSVAAPAVTNVTCSPNGACTQEKRNFAPTSDLAVLQGVTDINLGKLQFLRQYVASGPNPDGRFASGKSWTVDLAGTQQANQPQIFWKALAQTYCYY